MGWSLRRRGRAFALAALLLFAGSCREPEPWSEQGVQELVERTMPPGASLVSFSGLTRDESGVSAEWEIATGMAWSAYVLWIKVRLGKDFSTGPGERSPLSFRNVLPGDEVSLRVERLLPGPPLHVRVTFRAGPF